MYSESSGYKSSPTNDDRLSGQCSRCPHEHHEASEGLSTTESKYTGRSSKCSKYRAQITLLEEQRRLQLQLRLEEDDIRKKRALEDKEFLNQKYALQLALLDELETEDERIFQDSNPEENQQQNATVINIVPSTAPETQRATLDQQVTQSARQQYSNVPQLNETVELTPTSTQLAARQVINDLPPFTGDPKDWPLFSSSFENSTIACGYTDAENLARLRTCLKGIALDHVRSRLFLPQSVPLVMETLRKLYGRPEILIHALLEELRSTPSPSEENLQSIIDYGMAVRNIVDHAYMADLQDHLRNPMLLYELIQKLPPTYRLQWSRFKRAYGDVNLETFGLFMADLVDAAVEVTIPSSTETCAKSQQENSSVYSGVESQNNTQAEITPVREALYVHTNLQGNKPSRKIKRACFYCLGEDHLVVQCHEFKALELSKRWKAVQLKGLCKQCLIPHRTQPCRSRRMCEIDSCYSPHHTLLHGANESTTVSTQLQSSKATKAYVNVHNINSQLNEPKAVYADHLRMDEEYTGGNKWRSLQLHGRENVGNQLGSTGSSCVGCECSPLDGLERHLSRRSTKEKVKCARGAVKCETVLSDAVRSLPSGYRTTEQI